MKKVSKIVIFILFLIYLIYLLYLVFFSHYYGRTYIHHSYNLIPFNTISQYLFSNTGSREIMVNIGGNILAFLPMGLMFPIVSNRLDSIFRITAALLFATCSIEILQYLAGVGVGDIDDIILNLLGGLLGYLIYSLIKMKIKRRYNNWFHCKK